LSSVKNASIPLSQNPLDESWYWEITVVSVRHTKVGYTFKDDKVHGITIDIHRPNEVFGLLLDKSEKKFKVYRRQGLFQEVDLEEKFIFHPSIEIAPLQQVTFNFGKPILEKPKGKLLSELQCASNLEEYTCDETTFRQSVAFPFMQQEYNVEFGKKKLKYKADTNQKVTPSEPSLTISAPMHSVSMSGKVEIPQEFKCPITLDIMVDPVIVPDGNRYERNALLQWLSDGNMFSPLTKQPLSFKDLKSDHELRERIETWRKSNLSE